MPRAFDQEETLCGQGTLGAELQEQAPQLDTVLVAVDFARPDKAGV